MTVLERQLTPGIRCLTLESEAISVTVLPDKGSDIYSIIDRPSGIDFLFKSPWGLRRPGPGSHSPGSAAHWLEHYPGGWQLLCPNGGGPSIETGIEWGFHGEACLLPWNVQETGQNHVLLDVRLFRAPLFIERRISVERSVLRIEEAITNESPDPIEFVWGHHPAFGAPFIDGGCRLATGARTLVADDLAPGSMLAPASRHAWPDANTVQGEPLDLRKIPGPEDVRSHLAYLEDFGEGFFAITNPRLKLGIGLRWPLDIFPHAWFWQEVHGLPGYPWFRRAYVVAVEPNTTVPAQGLTAAREKGGSGISLAGGERREVTIEAIAYRGDHDLESLDKGGAALFQHSRR